MTEVTKEVFYKYILDDSFEFPNDIVHEHGPYESGVLQSLYFKHRGSGIRVGESITHYGDENKEVYKLTPKAIEYLEKKGNL